MKRLRSKQTKRRFQLGLPGGVEPLEARRLLAVTPTASIDAPANALLGEEFEFSVAFDNLGSPGEVGYQPFVDILLPTTGAEDTEEGIDLGPSGVSFLGQTSALNVTERTFDVLGEVSHPLTGETITGTPGDTLIVAQPWVGSFTPGQPELTLDVGALLSNFANLGSPLSIRARAGFDFGSSPTDNGNILSDGTDSSSWTASATIAPSLAELEKTYLGPEDETATGPNFPQQYRLDINVADGQTITDLDIRDYLPNNVRFTQVVSATSTDAATIFATTPPSYTLDPVTNQVTFPDPHELLVNASTVTGQAGDSPEITIVFEYYVTEFDSEGDRVIPDDNLLSGAASGDGEDDIAPGAYPDHAAGTPLLDLDSTSPNDADALGDWTPLDPDDPGTTDNVYLEHIDAAPDHVLDDKAIAIQKSVSLVTDNNSPGFSPVDIVEYTLTFQVSDYYTFGDLAVYDILGDGLLFDQTFDPVFTISDRSGTHSNAFNWSVSSNPADQQAPGAADTLSLPTGNLLVDESRVDRADDGAENPVSDGTSHLIFNIDQALLDDGRSSGILQGGVVNTDAELRPGDGAADEHDDAAAAPAVGQITYRAQIQQEFADTFPSGDRSIDHGDILDNTVDIYGTVRDNIVPATVTHREDDDSGTAIETLFGEISKSIYAINGDTSLGSGSGINNFGLIVGDTITYSIEYTLPNSNFEDLVINDFLPYPVLEVDDPNADDNSDETTPDDGPAWFFDTSAPSTSIPAVGVISIGENDTFYGVSSTTDANAGRTHYENNVSASIDFDQNRLSFDYGDFDTDQDTSSTIHVYFTIRINDAQFDPNLFLTNTTRVNEASTNGPDNAVDDLILIQMETPTLQVRKGVVGASSPSAVFSTAPGPGGVVFAPPGSAGTPFSGTVSHSGLNSTLINANVSQVRPGDSVRFAVVLRNTDNRAPMFDVQLRDSLPTGLTYIPHSLQVVDGTGDVIAFADLDGLTDGSGFFGTGIELLDPGPTDAADPDYGGRRGAIDGRMSGDGRSIAIAFYDAVVTDAAGSDQNFTNAAVWFNGAGSEGGPNIGSASDSATVARARVDLELDKQVSNPTPQVGEVVTWTVQVTNNPANATTTATGVVVEDTLPSGQQIVVGSATDTTGGTFDYYTGDWTLGSGIPRGGTATLTFESIVGPGAEYLVDWVDLELDVEISDSQPAEGDTVTMSYRLTNSAEAATVAATGVSVADLLPAGLTFVAASDTVSHGAFNSGTGVWDLSAETLAVGQTVTLEFDATVDGGTDGTSLPVAARVTALNENDIDSTPGNAAASEDDDATQSIDVANPMVPPPVDARSRVWIDDNKDGVQDAGEGVVSGVTLQLYDASGASPVFVTDTTTDGSGVYSFAGLSASTDYQIRMDPADFASGGVLEQYRITKPEIEPISVATTVVPVSGPAAIDRTNDTVNETAADQTIDILTPLALASDEVQVVITDMVGGVARLNEDQDVEFTFFDYETSGSFAYHIVDDRFDSDAAGYDDDGDGMTDRAVVSFTTDSSGGASWSSLDFGVIYEEVDLALAKVVDRKVALEGEDVTFRVTLTNESEFLSATGVTVTDSLPAGLTYVSGSESATQGSFDGVTWTLGGEIAPGETVTLKYRANVSASAGSVLSNNAEVASMDQSDVDSTPGNEDGDFSEDDEANAVILVGTRTATTITNVAQVAAQDQLDWDSSPANDDHDQSEDDEDSAMLTFSIPGAIGNLVWVDEDSNGVADAGEPGIANVLVQLRDGAGTVIATTRTDADGSYLFPDLDSGNYFVDIDESTIPVGMTQSTAMPSPGGDQTNQSHALDGYSIALGPGEENMTADFGYNYNATSDVDGNTGVATLGDRVWADTDGDGFQDPGEVGVEGVTVGLFTDPDGDGVYDTSAGSRTTDASGLYWFDNLSPNAYVVRINPTGSPVAGWTQTGDPEDWGRLASNPDQQSSPVVLQAGDVNLDIDFGFQPPVGASGSIGSTVWFDLNNSGDDESNIGDEPRLEGVTVSLIRDSDGDGTWAPATEPIIATDTTDGSGQYLFTGLALDDGDGDADYIVWVNDTQNILDQFMPSYDPDGVGTAHMSATALDVSSPDDLDQDFSYVQATSATPSGGLGDTVFLDRNNDGSPDAGEGIEGVEVLIYDYEGRLISNVFTDENGRYFFDNLDPAEEYRITVNTLTLPPGLTNTVDPDGGSDSESLYDLGPDPDDIDVNQDFGYLPSGTAGSIGTLVWTDTNRDGVADGANGPDGLPNTDDDEPGVAGVTIDLYRDNNNDGVLNAGDTRMGRTETDSSGGYLFSNLLVDDGVGGPVNYIVDVTDVAGVLHGFHHSLGTQGVADDNQSKADPYAVPLSVGVPDVVTADFGYFNENASLGNYVWIDTNRDGIQNASDFGANGVPVTLTIDDGVSPITARVLTESGPNGKAGWYRFHHLLADEDLNGSEATYTISIDSHFTSPSTHYSLIPALVDVVSGGPTPDREDSDDHSGVIATPVVGMTDVDDLLDENNEQSIASYDFGFNPTDHGDLPDSYNTLNSNTGAFHEIDLVTFLGASVDWELDGQPTADATGDGADEDGVVFNTPLTPGADARVTVTASTTGFLNAWIDFDSNGQFDVGEQVAIDQPLSAGPNSLTISVPATATGQMPSRFRFSNDDPSGAMAVDGYWPNGEVEDYVLGSLGDVVWHDNGVGGGTPADGIQNGSEPGVPNVVVNLLDALGNPITDASGNPNSTITDANGNYEFLALPPGDYRVEFIEPQGFVFVDANQGGDEAVDSDANQSTGITDQAFNMAANTLDDTVDAGLIQVDLGDLPDGYGTLQASGGARHGIDGTTFLGASVDAELDGTPSDDALGDDNSGLPDDEDGVVFLTPISGDRTASVQVTASNSGFLHAWIDFDLDGSLDEIDVVSVDGVSVAPGTTLNDLALTGGVHNIVFQPPGSTVAGNFARFRYTADDTLGSLGPGGDWDNGEVEDYYVEYDLALTKAYLSDNFGNTGNGQVGPGSDATFVMTVVNQGDTPVFDFELTDYLPMGFVLNDPNWTFNNDATPTSGGTATFTYAGPSIAPNASADINITLTAVNPTLADLVNRAEISGDDGNDIDSLADAIGGNDNQPANPGDPTDGVVDNSAGDEDDHDVAGFDRYDLALTMEYTSDTSNQGNDGIVARGADVTYTIEVTNQGSVSANSFEVTAYLPLGFSLNDSNWTFNNDATATSGGTATLSYGGSSLTPSSSTSVALTLTATAPSVGNLTAWAEISGDDGDDADSTTDTTQGNDNQPVQAGDPTDGVIDGTAGDEDDHDPAAVQLPLISLSKQITGIPATASSGMAGNYDVVYELVVTNVGTTTLDSVALVEDVRGHFGGAFVRVVGAPVITASTATDDPDVNTNYDGGLADANLFDGSPSTLLVGEAITTRVTIEVDPDASTAIYDSVLADGNLDLENRAFTTANDPSGNPVEDLSDDPNDLVDGDGDRGDASDDDGEPDDPTSLIIPAMAVEKVSVGLPTAPASGTAGNLDVTYQLVVRNTGNDDLTNLSLVEDLASQFGGAFVRVVGTPTIVTSSATDPPEINIGFNGSTDTEMFDNTGGNTSRLRAQEAVTVEMVVETDPSSPTAIFVNGLLANSAVGSSDAVSSGGTLSDASDDTSDGTNADPNGDGSPDDPTLVALTLDLSGTVFVDTNGNGVHDPGETGIIGVEIVLEGTDIGGNPVSVSVLTNADGDYLLEDVFPGTYTLTEVQPSQFIDGLDAAGTLGGTVSNDQIALTIPPGSMDGFDYDFGEGGLRAEFVSKNMLLASTPANYWSNVNATAGGTLGVFVPFTPTTSGAVQAVLINADSIQTDLFDADMQPLTPAQDTDGGGTWVVHEGEQYYVRLRGEDANFDLGLEFGDDVDLPVSLEMDDSTVIVVGTAGDDQVELRLGTLAHHLSIADYQFEFDASVIDTFHVGSSTGNDSITVVGTQLDDTGFVLEDRGRLTSSAYSVTTYTFDQVIFDGQGGQDYTEVFGSSGDDTLHGLPQQSTLTTPEHTYEMIGFERVDSYGRGGNDYGSMYGTQGDDTFYTFDTYEVLIGEGMTMRTIGWDRVDAFGRGGDDTAVLHDSAGNDHFYAFRDYAVMVSPHLYAVAKGFESVRAESREGGQDVAHLRQLTALDHLFARDGLLAVSGTNRDLQVEGFPNIEAQADDEDEPTTDIAAQLDFVFRKIGAWAT